jgi:predicted DNA-binding transcriptional regulator YafY
MYSPTTRLLTLLELLQSRGSLTGAEIAAKLEVEVRSVRRYITMLRDLGIPVESERGRYGAYSLRPGFRLPPLMFNEGEIVAVVLGLMLARQMGMAPSLGSESALAKIERVLPDALSQRVRALEQTLVFDLPEYDPFPDERVSLFSTAAYELRQLWIAYAARSSPPSERVIDVYGLVHHTGYWYAAAYCHLRADLRTFRLDRVMDARLLPTTFTPPPDFDALDYLLRAIATMPDTWEIDLILHTTLVEARSHIPRDVGVVEESDGQVHMRGRMSSLDWMARFLLGTGIRFTILQPDALRGALRELGEEALKIADGG